MIPFKSPIVVSHVGDMKIGKDFSEGNRLPGLGIGRSARLDEEIGETLCKDGIDGRNDTG